MFHIIELLKQKDKNKKNMNIILDHCRMGSLEVQNMDILWPKDSVGLSGVDPGVEEEHAHRGQQSAHNCKDLWVMQYTGEKTLSLVSLSLSLTFILLLCISLSLSLFLSLSL